jgi:geranylgeranyl diphosphate synthase type 3
MLSYQNIKRLVLTVAGLLFMFGIQLMQLFSENKTDFTKLLVILRQYLQIQNDYCNMWQQEVMYELWFLDS